MTSDLFAGQRETVNLQTSVCVIYVCVIVFLLFFLSHFLAAHNIFVPYPNYKIFLFSVDQPHHD